MEQQQYLTHAQLTVCQMLFYALRSSCTLPGEVDSYLTYFSEKETGAKRRQVSCQGSPNQKIQSQ